MRRSLLKILVAAVLIAAPLTASVPQPAEASSCTNSLNTCAARCRKDVPDDRNCVSDHCSPKFNTCKVTGCWQEGARYGNVKTCDLAKR